MGQSLHYFNEKLGNKKSNLLNGMHIITLDEEHNGNTSLQI